MLLRDIMKHSVVSVPPDLAVSEAARKMEEHNVGCLLVMEEGQVKGILTDRDIVLKVVAKGGDPVVTRVADTMQPNVIWARTDMDVLEASRLMSATGVRRLPVLEEGRVAGIVSITDLSRIIQEELDNLLSLRASPTSQD